MSKLLLTLLLVTAGVSHAAPGLARVSGEAAWSKSKSAASATLRAPALAAGNQSEVRFGFMDAARIDALKERNAQPEIKALQIGINREIKDELPGLGNPQLAWVATADGGKAAQLLVSSPGAKSLRVGLNVRSLPAGAELRVASAADPQNAIGVVSAAELRQLRRESPLYWTALTEGESQIVELYLPAGTSAAAVGVEIEAVSHVLGSPSMGFKDAVVTKEAGACNRNTACEAQTAAFVNAKNAVAKMVFTSGCGSNGQLASCLCTGTLVNDNDPSSQIPYFFSGSHCIGSQVEANSLNTIWFYEGASCGSAVAASGARTLSGGAKMLMSDPSTDVLVLRLNDEAPAGAYFSGWDPNTLLAGQSITSIHHPDGSLKKVTLGKVVQFADNIGIGDLAISYSTAMAWTSGTTEGGSSGSPAFTFDGGEYFLRGGLIGGSASCSNSGNINNTGNRDYYSRLDQSYASVRKILEVDYSGVWNVPGEEGLGLSILRGSSGALGVIWYQYTPQRQPTWFLLGGGWTGPTTYSGTWLSYAANGYDVPFAASSVTSSPAGSGTFNFTSPTTATLTYTLPGGVTGTKNLKKMDF